MRLTTWLFGETLTQPFFEVTTHDDNGLVESSIRLKPLRSFYDPEKRLLFRDDEGRTVKELHESVLAALPSFDWSPGANNEV